jgi:hypothetical protein
MLGVIGLGETLLWHRWLLGKVSVILPTKVRMIPLSRIGSLGVG